MKHILTIIIFVFSTLCTLQAQVPAKISEAAKTLESSSKVAQKLSRYNGNLGAVSGIDFYLLQDAATRAVAQASFPATTQEIKSVPKPERSWFTQQVRDIKAGQLKRQRKQQQLAEKKAQLAAQELEAVKANLPPLIVEGSFTVADFTDLVPSGEQANPIVPFVAEPKKIAYRGMALDTDAEAIRNIIKNGLRLQDAGKENSTLRMAYASHTGWRTMSHIAQNPVTNITDSPTAAAAWGIRRLSAKKPILTIVKIKGEFEGTTIEIVTTDIPADQIEEVAVRVNINGNLMWCKTQLNEDGSLTLTPYEPRYNTAK